MTRVHELFNSRENTYSAKPRQSSGELLYIVKDQSDETTARAAALAVAPSIWDGKIFRNVSLERIAADKWIARCQYDDNEEPLDVGEWRLSFDTTGGTVNKTVAFEERAYPATAPPQHSAINVQDGKVMGIDVPVGSLKFTITYRQPRGNITVAYARTLAALVGKVNNATFYGFAARELMFLGASGQQGTQVDPEINYNFLAGEHLTNFTIGGITVALKEAHEHLWASFVADVEEGGAEPKLIQQPEAIYVDQVAEEANFALIGIGTA